MLSKTCCQNSKPAERTGSSALQAYNSVFKALKLKHKCGTCYCLVKK